MIEQVVLIIVLIILTIYLPYIIGKTLDKNDDLIGAPFLLWVIGITTIGLVVFLLFLLVLFYNWTGNLLIYVN